MRGFVVLALTEEKSVIIGDMYLVREVCSLRRLSKRTVSGTGHSGTGHCGTSLWRSVEPCSATEAK